jgi:hypothetical protein
MNPFEPKHELIQQNAITKPTGLENIELVPMKVTDLRNSQHSSFDLNKFVTTVGRLRSEGLYKLSREFQDSDYGKYMSTFASAESDNWDEAIQKAKAIEITATTETRTFGFEHREGRTEVEVKVLMPENEGRIFNFYFDKDGKYSRGGWKDVRLQKRLTTDENEFTLDVDNESKKLE